MQIGIPSPYFRTASSAIAFVKQYVFGYLPRSLKQMYNDFNIFKGRWYCFVFWSSMGARTSCVANFHRIIMPPSPCACFLLGLGISPIQRTIFHYNFDNLTWVKFSLLILRLVARRLLTPRPSLGVRRTWK